MTHSHGIGGPSGLNEECAPDRDTVCWMGCIWTGSLIFETGERSHRFGYAPAGTLRNKQQWRGKSSSAFWGSTSEDGGKRRLTYLEIGGRQLRVA